MTASDNFPTEELPSLHNFPRITLKEFLPFERVAYSCASSVSSSAGGGNHGCLGQIMPEDTYIALAGVPYIMPVDPGPWQPPAGGAFPTTVQMEQHRADRIEQKEQAKTARELERALKRMIIQAVPERYLAVLRSPLTGGYDGHTVREMLTHLRNTVAKLTPKQLHDEYDRIAKSVFDPDNMEVTQILTEIQFLGRLATAVDLEYSDPQLVALAINIFTNCGYFSDGIRAWNARPAAERTLVNLHQHFVDEQATLRELNPQGIGAMVGYQANILQECTNTMHQQQQQFMEMMNVMRQEHANFVANVSNSNTTSSGDKPKKKKKEKQTEKATKQVFQQEGNENNPCKYYCWVHGVNNSHPSYACNTGLNNKETYPNFRADATFANRMGGKWKGSFE